MSAVKEFVIGMAIGTGWIALAVGLATPIAMFLH
ncbi:hypothetical protein CBA19CS22_38030 [Caballeronia novacaledonica]|jgi:hypothetical protein|uniref:Uncharacterized protein n=1 Tax=Caballeronia novacaledonica TaxID=1544861 RepID=A0ACB5R6I8_9BURK|nr:hypothetical protein CBA19CS22_38030 [Caballeronia novacaledonica]